ncbi:hypothetical protein LB529_16845 [Mesorhizobium sp. CA5]|nr:hypothetical protein [Mesorhizobium sp. CA5]
MVIVEHGRRLLQRLVSSLCVLPGSRHFENYKFHRHPVLRGFGPFKNQSAPGRFVPATVGRSRGHSSPTGEGVWLQPLGADTAPGKNGRKTTLIV